ncbi:MAG: hypothetical protein ACM3X1_09585 [Ignavibacteriales bacterium]
MKLFEAVDSTHHELDINWTMLFNEKDDNKTVVIIVIIMVKVVINEMSKKTSS